MHCGQFVQLKMHFIYQIKEIMICVNCLEAARSKDLTCGEKSQTGFARF